MTARMSTKTRGGGPYRDTDDLHNTLHIVYLQFDHLRMHHITGVI
jgi:hypothetical protein